MAYTILPKSGIRVLAYTSDTSSPLPCTLLIKYHHTRKQATLSLQSSVSILGFDDEQTFTIIYNAENLVPAGNSLRPATTRLSQLQLAELARHSDPQLTTLGLTVKEPCPIWCPIFSGSITAKDGFETSFNQLVSLGKATQVHIIFDHKWLHRDFNKQFEELISQPENFIGFSVDQNDAKRRVVDWSAFSPVGNETSGDLPTYAEVFGKRPRTSSTSSEVLRPSKRVFQPAASISAPSPTEVATTEPTSSPRLLSSPGADVHHLQSSVESAVRDLLPGVLKKMLPDVISHLFTVPPSSPLPVPTSPSSERQVAPPPSRTSSLGSIVSERVAAHAEAQLRAIYDEAVEYAMAARSTADDEFLEIVEDHKVDVRMVKEDSMTELQVEVNGKLVEFRETVAEIVREAAEQAEQVYSDICTRLDKLAESTKVRLRLDKLAESTKVRLRSDREIRDWGEKYMEVKEGAAGDRTRRASTLPT